MLRYPLLEINSAALLNNTRILTALCGEHGIDVAGVVKGFNGLVGCSQIMIEGGCRQIASSRIDQLMKIKEYDSKIETMLIRIPMFSEIPYVVAYADISLVSELQTLRLIDAEALMQGKSHRVVLMYDLGDLREGVMDRDELNSMAVKVVEELKNIELCGIGTNLSCYGSVKPTSTNLKELAEAAVDVEEATGRSLSMVSGGATTVLPALLRGHVPSKINHLRLGESIICAQDLPLYWDCNIEGLSKDTAVLKAQIVELNSKPTFPVGERGVAAFGKIKTYVDRGVRKRAIVAVGNQDIGDSQKIIPKDEDIQVLGASGDHTILDIEDCSHEYHLGDTVEFNVMYQAMVYLTMSPSVCKIIT